MEIFDLTLTISPSLPIWPGDTPIQLERVSKMENGDSCNVTKIQMSAHTGTHVDAPYHFIADGKTVESLDLNVLNGNALVIEISAQEKITAKDFAAAQIPVGTSRLLIKTSNSSYWQTGISEFQTDFVALSVDAAEWLVKNEISLVGVDYLSVAPFNDSTPTHKVLLGAGMIIVEGLDLSSVSPGTYEFHCLPLKLAKTDGAPTRAILIKN